jgi:hypothetical protein
MIGPNSSKSILPGIQCQGSKEIPLLHVFGVCKLLEAGVISYFKIEAFGIDAIINLSNVALLKDKILPALISLGKGKK